MGTIKKRYHIQGKKGSHFSQQLRGLDLEQVLIVAIDAAKLHQKALICNYFGDVIERPFYFSVNVEGITDLCSKIEQAREKVDAKLLLLGVEATGHYYEDIVRTLGARGYGVQIFNAYTTYEERASALNWCKTDDLDLVALAHAIMRNKGTQNVLPEGKHRELLVLTRARRQEVQKKSRLQAEIRTYMDHIWREYQGYAVVENKQRKTKKIFSDFWGKSSLFILEHYPHPSMILELGEDGLRELSVMHNLKIRETTIQTLLHVAEQSLSRPIGELSSELLILRMKIQDWRRVNENINQLEKEMEIILLQTDGALLLTVPGIGLNTAAELYSELGDINLYDSPNQLIKKAGTNPIVIQSGGKKGYFGAISKQGNSHLRFIVYLVGKSPVQHNKDLQPFFQRLKDKGKHHRKIYIAMGNKFIKIAYAMLRDKKTFESKQPNYNMLAEVKKKLRYLKVSNMFSVAS